MDLYEVQNYWQSLRYLQELLEKARIEDNQEKRSELLDQIQGELERCAAPLHAKIKRHSLLDIR